jgi:hypothetical protein
MPRIGGTIQAAVPGAKEVGVRARGVGCEVDYAHFGSRGMRLCVCGERLGLVVLKLKL